MANISAMQSTLSSRPFSKPCRVTRTTSMSVASAPPSGSRATPRCRRLPSLWMRPTPPPRTEAFCAIRSFCLDQRVGQSSSRSAWLPATQDLVAAGHKQAVHTALTAGPVTMLLAEGTFEVFWELLGRWSNRGSWPPAWRRMRQVHLRKETQEFEAELGHGSLVQALHECRAAPACYERLERGHRS